MTKKMFISSKKQLYTIIHEQAKELIEFGNSKEKAEGYGMQKVIDAIYLLETLYKSTSKLKK